MLLGHASLSRRHQRGPPLPQRRRAFDVEPKQFCNRGAPARPPRCNDGTRAARKASQAGSDHSLDVGWPLAVVARAVTAARCTNGFMDGFQGSPNRPRQGRHSATDSIVARVGAPPQRSPGQLQFTIKQALQRGSAKTSGDRIGHVRVRLNRRSSAGGSGPS